ncbi:MAG: CZB domain-containing protein, partial [Sulfurimonas sp.]|nr:CZB domain-containing protein [Sulfurimonas sp.]
VLAKIDHILFKEDAKEFETHNSCRFGKWYDTDGQSQFKHSKSFKEILTPHAIVHSSVIDTFKLIQDKGSLMNEDKIKANFIKMESASDTLFLLMDNMLDEEADYSNNNISDGEIELWDLD